MSVYLSKDQELTVGSFLPGKFQGSAPRPDEGAIPKRDEKTALECLWQISKDSGRALSIRFGKRQQWTVEIQGFTGRGFDFLQAVGNLLADMFPDLKAQVDAEKEDNQHIGHA